MSSLDESRIWVGGLPDGVTEDEIKDEFKKYGEVKHIQIRANPGSPCFAFVQYTDRHDAEDAISGANQAKLFGQSFVKVSWAGKTSKGKGKGKRDRSRSRSRSRRDSHSRSRRQSRSRSPPRRRTPSPRKRSASRRGRSGGGDRQRSPARRSPARERRPATPPPRSRSPRREAPRPRSRTPPRREPSHRRSRSLERKGQGKGSMEQGKFRVQVEKLPEDMGWQELKDVGTKFAKAGQCTFARTRRDCTGVLEFTDAGDMAAAIKELDGRRFSGGGVRLVAYEDKSR